MNTAEFTTCRVYQPDDLADKLGVLKNETVDGFIRFSDAEREMVLEKSAFPAIDFTAVSFLFEAAFYVEGKYSVMIRQMNDFWLINRVDWKILPPESSKPEDDYVVYTQKNTDYKEMLFYTQYLPVDNCGFKTLTPAWNAFIGFEKGE